MSRGFTLIELSIVMIILGLLAGGIVVGRSMVEAAKYRSFIAEFREIEIAVTTFRGKYKAFPGDLPNADRFWATATNGNGDGIPNDTNSFGQHLLLAGLIKNTLEYSGNIYAKSITLGKENIVFAPLTFIPCYSCYSDEKHVSLYLNEPAEVSNVYFSNEYSYNFQGPLSPEEAYITDNKMDDGVASTGKLGAVHMTNGLGNDCTGTTATGYQYIKTTSNSPTCALLYNMFDNRQGGYATFKDAS